MLAKSNADSSCILGISYDTARVFLGFLDPPVNLPIKGQVSMPTCGGHTRWREERTWVGFSFFSVPSFLCRL